MNDSNDSGSRDFYEQLVCWLTRMVSLLRWRWVLRVVVVFLIFSAGIMVREFWHLYFQEIISSISVLSEQQNDSTTPNDSSTQPIEKIHSIAKQNMEEIYRLSKCKTDWLYNINVNKVDFEDERISRELKQKSRGNVDQEKIAKHSGRKSQESNLEQRISATKSLLQEIERLSMQIMDIWSLPHSRPGLAINCVE